MHAHVAEPSTNGARRRLLSTRTVLALGSLGAILFGYENGIVAGAILFIPEQIPLSSGVEGFVVSSAVLGAMAGALVSGPFSDRVGRQRLLLAAGVAFAIGAVGAALAQNVAMLIVFRVVLGLGIGISSVSVPIYLSEMAPAALRGVVTSLNQYMIVIGTGLAGGIGFALSFSASWRWMFAAGVFPAAALIVGILFMPDTPRSLVRRGRQAEAAEVLRVLRSDPAEAERELADITRVRADEAHGGAGLRRSGLGATWVRRLLAIGVMLAIFQQITGINAIVYYSPSVLTQIGVSQSGSLLFSFANGVLNIGSIALVVRLRLVDRWGRKPILLAGLVGLAASQFVVGVANLTTAAGSAPRAVLTIGAFVLFTNVFSATWGPTLWVVLAEIYPLRVRGAAVAIATLFNWGADFFVSQTFPTFADAVGAGWVLLAYGIVGVIIYPIVARAVPETKERSLEDLERWLRGSDRTSEDP